MDELIYRYALLEQIEKDSEGTLGSYGENWQFINTIRKMPTIERRSRGHWIKIPEFHGDDVSGFIDNHFSCSECKKEAEINPWGFYILSDFCPSCGADMRGDSE